MSDTKLPKLVSKQAKNPSPSSRRRGIIYWFSVPMMRDLDLSGVRARAEALAADNGMVVVDFIVDSGRPKKRRGDYPMLARFERGEADVLIVGRSDLRRRSPDQDWLESRARPRPVALYTVDELRRLGVLDRKRAADSAPRSEGSPFEERGLV